MGKQDLVKSSVPKGTLASLEKVYCYTVLHAAYDLEYTMIIFFI